MKLLIQRVSQAQVTVDGTITGKIARGLVVLIGIHKEDNADSIPWLVQKLISLRVFADGEGKMNLNIQDVEGEILLVSQFTLYGTCTKGRRPEFTQAAQGDQAQVLYDNFVEECRKALGKVETGRFATHMEVSLVNDGPVTLILEKL